MIHLKILIIRIKVFLNKIAAEINESNRLPHVYSSNFFKILAEG